MRQHCAGSHRDWPCGTGPADHMRHPPGDRPPCLAASGVLGSQRGGPARGRPPSSARGRAGCPRMGRALWGGQRRWGGRLGGRRRVRGRPLGAARRPWGALGLAPPWDACGPRLLWASSLAGAPGWPTPLPPALPLPPLPRGPARPSARGREALAPAPPGGLPSRAAWPAPGPGPPHTARASPPGAGPALRGGTTCWGPANNPRVGFRHGGTLARARGSGDARPRGGARRGGLPPPDARSGLAPQGPWVVARGRGGGGWCRTKTVPRRRTHP